MKLGDIFEKDIARPIQGVVKIGQDSAEVISAELDEYVVTKELHRHFEKFFASYTKGTKQRTDKIGVWISGFFGSGKSHFLKILSYVLGDGWYNGKNATDYFNGKMTNDHVMADMQLAANTSADVILFNIDAEADSDSKSNKDPIVKVFMKVFNKMQGYCSTMPWVADLERQMAKDGVYEDFCSRFLEISGSNWEDARNDFYFEQDNIVAALADATRMSADAALAWYNKAEDNYTLDINSFARRVREYIEAKEATLGKKHFVMFLCDEVGQYVGSSSALMLNLQNIVEGLGNECGGQAWVIATGQEDIDSITKVNRDNFSKIIGRFDTRLSLSSANVDEVIKKRLLAKTDASRGILRALYADKEAVLKNLITFTDAGDMYLYDSADDFADVYPFIPYQFKLLQAVFNGIRTHGASGKHLSEGERSLLNAFQEAAMLYADHDEGILIPFDAFYRTVETFLDHNIRRVILEAEESAAREDGSLQAHDVEVLKVLFMVKYIPNVLPANLENISTIMIDSIDQDKIELKKKVDASLRRLEDQRLIARNGEQFIFLTNEEQDINREIREVRIDPKELTDRVGGLIFEVLFGTNRKYRHNERHDFAINTLIDDRPLGAQREEIGIRIITPYYALGGTDEATIRLMSGNERNVIVLMPGDTAFLDEMEQSMQIDAFLRKKSGVAATEAVEDIKTTKFREAKQRVARCRELVAEALRTATFYVNSNRLDIREKAPEHRVNEAFGVLVESIYSRQGYVAKPFLTSDDLREIVTAGDSGQIELEGIQQLQSDPNHLAIADMLEAIERSYAIKQVTTMRSLLEYFGKMPYGWKDMDIAGIALTLFRMQKIRLELGGESILSNDPRTVDYTTRREHIDRLVVKWRDIVSPALVSNAREIAREVFGRSDVPNDEDGLMARIKILVDYELYKSDESINKLLDKYEGRHYPGKPVLAGGKKMLEQLERIKDMKAFYDYLYNHRDALLDYEEDARDIKNFFKVQRGIFDNALKMLDIYEGNRTFVLDAEAKRLVEDIERITRLESPYSQIRELPGLVDRFQRRFEQILEDECIPIRAAIEADLAATLTALDQSPMKATFEAQVQADFNALLDRLSRTNSILAAVGMPTESDRLKQRFMAQFVSEQAPKHKTKTLTMKNLFGGATQIASEADIDRLLADLRTKLKAQLDEDTTIHII